MLIGMARSLAQEVVNNAFIDLNPIAAESSVLHLLVETQSLLLKQCFKHHNLAIERGSMELQADLLSGITLGDALKSEGWRSDVHLLLINIATNSQKGDGLVRTKTFTS
ncbi:hypothetical protein GBA52_028452 [Prunus armeniaca]|nr:hypothetical protein GBA52_028452 [Prunus armeniaca]